MDLYRPVAIGSLELPGNLFLAPVAGYSDRAFRSVCIDCGADFTCTEMVSSEALTRNKVRTEPLLARAENENRYAVQLFGADPDAMYRAALLLAPWRPDGFVEVPGVPVGQIARKGEVEIQVQDFFGVLRVLGVAVQHPAPGRQPVPEYVQHVLPRVPVVDNYRQIQLGRHVQLGNKKLNLGLFVPKFAVIIQANLPYGHNPGQLNVLLNHLDPVLAGALDLRGRNPNGVVHVGGGF
jgi:hypothetical protein